MSKSELYTCIVESINSSESFHNLAANKNKKHGTHGNFAANTLPIWRKNAR